MDLTPQNKEILEVLSPQSDADTIVYVKGTQIAGTTITDVACQAIIDLYPAAYWMVFANNELARNHVIMRVERAFEQNNRLKGKVKSSYDRKSGTNRHLKMFPGGYGRYSGGRTGTAWRHDSYMYVFIDDIDGFLRDIGGTNEKIGEGSPVELGRSRLDAQQGRGKLYVSGTPTDLETSIVWAEYLKTDQRKRFITCPKCGFEQLLDWFHIKFERNEDYELMTEPEFECEKCKARFPETLKPVLLLSAKWKPTKEIRDKKKIGFWCPSQYSMLGLSWRQMAQEWLEAVERQRMGDIKKMVRFYNHRLALPFEREYKKKISIEETQDSKLDIDLVPGEAVILTAGIDIQSDRFEMTVVGYAENDHRYFVEHKKIYGNPWLSYGQDGSPWEDLEQAILEKYFNEFETMQPILKAALDMGYCQEKASLFLREMHKKGVPVVGTFGGTNRTKNKDFIGKPVINKNGVEQFEINVSAGKELTYNQLKRPGDQIILHFLNHHSFDKDFFRGLLAETPDGKGGWSAKPGVRNEPTDTTNYSLAAFEIFRNGAKIDWESFKRWNQNGCKLNSKKESVIISAGETV
jgi:phage terminase large subunit GpA-like protein